MKILKLFLFTTALFLTTVIHAQVSVNVNVGTPPLWGPVGYSEVQYYYLPDVEAYYDVPSSNFIYLDRGIWVHRTYLPTRYRHYDLYHGYKVVMTDYHGNTPYTHYKEYKYKYAKGYRGPAQKNIGERPNHNNRGNMHKENHGNGNNGKHSYDRNNDHGNNKNSNHGNGNDGNHQNKKGNNGHNKGGKNK